ncbi:MAG: hydantoinase/oxoprolinase family protein, partial [Gemmatimonadota bacterium]
HAVDLARALSMREAIVPPLPGTFSAVGLLVSDVRLDYVSALGGVRSDCADFAALERAYRALERQAAADLSEQGFGPAARSLVRYADLKVVGQTYELSLPLPNPGAFDAAGMNALLDAFAGLYRERYAFFFDGEPIEIVNLRVVALGRNAPIELPRLAPGGDTSIAQKGMRPVYFESLGFAPTAVYERDRLRPGMVIAGPALIEEETSSTLIPPGTHANVLDDLGLAVPLAQEKQE